MERGRDGDGVGKGRGYVMPPSWLGKFDSYITYIYMMIVKFIVKFIYRNIYYVNNVKE